MDFTQDYKGNATMITQATRSVIRKRMGGNDVAQNLNEQRIGEFVRWLDQSSAIVCAEVIPRIDDFDSQVELKNTPVPTACSKVGVVAMSKNQSMRDAAIGLIPATLFSAVWYGMGILIGNEAFQWCAIGYCAGNVAATLLNGLSSYRRSVSTCFRSMV
jgi:hypothetical protein